MIKGTVTVKVLHKGEKEPRLVQMSGAWWKDEDELKAHFTTHCPGSEFQGIDQSSKHEVTQ